MEMPTPCQNCGELHDLTELKETGERQQMVCSDCYESLVDKCDECGETIEHWFDVNEVDDGSPEGKKLCHDCFYDLCAEDNDWEEEE
ncbi:hypothetical protein [Vibrio sp. HN007]|uniref:hypothetical protein n=1 Tax=Vibrio iocasae TaxID=3098914 RepID=UPI0035D49C9F